MSGPVYPAGVADLVQRGAVIPAICERLDGRGDDPTIGEPFVG